MIPKICLEKTWLGAEIVLRVLTESLNVELYIISEISPTESLVTHHKPYPFSKIFFSSKFPDLQPWHDVVSAHPNIGLSNLV